jgi:hypothetical protein
MSETNEVVRKEIIDTDKHNIQALVGVEVFQYVNDKEFKDNWNKLYEDCPWSSIYQSWGFVSKWYEIYEKDVIPVLILSFRKANLVGLLALAKDNSILFGAGGNQAEYQVWLSTPTEGEEFMVKALELMKEKFPKNSVHLKYIPSNAPLNKIKEKTKLRNLLYVRVHRQPIINIQEENINKELKKKNKREKVNRLKRLGILSFERVNDVKIFEEIFDDLSSQYDLRKGAMFNLLFFKDDPLRKKFFIELFRQNLLHATVLKLNEEIIASNIGTLGKNIVHLQGINTHSPVYSKYSPGILHFLMLCLHLHKEGIQNFDLTPGEDPYKESLATDYLIVHEIILGSFFTPIILNSRNHLVSIFKKLAHKLGMDPQALKKIKINAALLYERASLYKKNGIIQSSVNLLRPKKTKVYLFENNPPVKQQHHLLNISKGSIHDLLKIDPNHSTITRRQFLQDSVQRFEVGEQPFSWTENNVLMCCAWLRGTTSLIHNNNNSDLEISGMYYHPISIPQIGLFLISVLNIVQNENNQQKVKLTVNFHDKTLNKAINEFL